MKNEFKNQISDEEIRDLPLIHFKGNIRVIQSAKEIEECNHYLKRQKILGFDTETKPSFKKGRRNGVSILQLATENQAFIFSLKKTGLPPGLINLLKDGAIIKAGVAIRDDIAALRKIRDFEPAGFVELQKHVIPYGIEQISLKKMTAIILNGRISKSQQTSNWDQDILTEAQLLYAATDAWCSYKIFTTLNHHE